LSLRSTLIALDTSSLIALLRNDDGPDVEAVDAALELQQAVLPPVVLTEILSDPKLDREVAFLVRHLPVLSIRPGFWERAAAVRASLLGKRLKARLADSLISQSCIDHQTPLITRDTDLRHFAAHAKLRLSGVGLRDGSQV
jgi:predicted nucleic acid-binding protein